MEPIILPTQISKPKIKILVNNQYICKLESLTSILSVNWHFQELKIRSKKFIKQDLLDS